MHNFIFPLLTRRVTAALVLAVAAAAMVQAAEPPEKNSRATTAPKSGSPYESDPGKYVEEPTKNMPAPKEAATKPGIKPRPGGASRTLDDTGLQRVLSKLPPGTRHQSTMMPLRDGVKLVTDIFLPPEGEGPWPTVLLRTQYSRWDERAMNSMKGTPCVLVVQNVRGAWGSEGAGTFDLYTFESDRNDGYDTIEWVAKQKWSNGKVGMWGPSGHGIAPINAMWALPPHLTVVDVNVTCDNPNLYFIYDNGARRFLYSWMAQRGLKTKGGEWPRPTVYPFNPDKYFDFLKETAPKIKTYYRINAGWFDVFSEAALDHFAILAPHNKMYAQMSASGHGALGGDLKFTARNKFPAEAQKISARGLKECLTEEKVPATKSCLAYFLMGDGKDKNAPGNVWMTTDKWPVDHKATSYYMHQDGSLSLEPSKDKTASLTYQYDPKNPVPTLGGKYDVSDPKRMQIGPLDQRPQADRKDILRFKSEPLSEPVGITGKIFAEIHVSSDCSDTMFTAKLVDIYPDGYEAVIRDSAMLARYSQGLDKPAPLEKGKVYKLKMDLWSTALVFNKGHRIGIYVSSSSDPAYEVHPNTYEPVQSIADAKVAQNTVQLSADHPSRLILPVVAKETYINLGQARP
jgi:predicted acyl esterase